MRGSIIVAGLLSSLLLLGGCNQDRISPLGSLGRPSVSDSLIYYFGLIEGERYMDAARKDTILASTRERERYLKGLKDGLKAVESVNDTYNRGLETGVALALNLYEYNRIYGIDLNRDLLYQSIAYALENDTILNADLTRQQFREVVRRLDLRKREQEVDNMHLGLAAEAKRLKMKKVSDDLYVTDANLGSGDSIRRGNLVFATLNYILENGHNLEMPSSQQLIVGGKTMPPVMTKVYTRMKKGGSAQYATTASALFGGHAYQLGLSPNEVVLMSVEITNVVDPDTTGKREDIAL